MTFAISQRTYVFPHLTFTVLQAQEGGSADLLGLGVPSAAGTNGAVNGAATVTNNIAKFHCKSNGVLYENEILQVVANNFESGKSFNPCFPFADWCEDRVSGKSCPLGNLLWQQDQLAFPQLPAQCHHLPYPGHESPTTGW